MDNAIPKEASDLAERQFAAQRTLQRPKPWGRSPQSCGGKLMDSFSHDQRTTTLKRIAK